MPTLVSPGVQVTVIDESFYGSAGPGTVPLVIIATEENKTVPDGTAIAEWTRPENAGKLFLATSQRELLQAYGDPIFRQVGGTALHGDPTNEYGLLAAHSYLGLANRAYVLRADVDLAELQPLDSAPTGEPVDGTYWLDLSSTNIGLFTYNATDDEFEQQEVAYITDATLLDSAGVPIASAPGAVGSYAVVPGVVAGSGTGREENQLFRRGASAWELIDASAISENVLYRPSNRPPLASEAVVIEQTAAGTGYAVGDIVRFATTPGPSRVIGAIVGSGGATYSNGDLVDLVGGTSTETAVFRVTGETAGSVDTVEVVTQGSYSVLPSNPASTDNTAYSGGGDNNLTLNVFYDNEIVLSVTKVGTSGEVEEFEIISRGFGQGADATGETQLTTTNAAGTALASGSGLTLNFTVLADGDFWIKTTSPDAGTVFGVNYYDSDVDQFIESEAPLSNTRDNALLLYGNNPSDGDLFVHYDHNNETAGTGVADFTARGEFSIMRHNGKTVTTATGITYSRSSSTGIDATTDIMTINGVEIDFTSGTTGDSNDKLPLTDESPQTGIVGVINSQLGAAGVTEITASASGGALVLTNSTGQDIEVLDSVGSPVATLFGASASEIVVTNGFVFSNWSYLSYEASETQPTGSLADGTLWYSNEIQVDILENNGLGQWDEFSGTVFVQSAEPSSGISVDDLWLDTDQTGDYPVISRYNGSEWIQIDNTDQTSRSGILFADARPTPTFGSDAGANNSGVLGFPDLDADRPDPLLYPRGMLLFNTRYSTMNVKRWTVDYTFDGTLVGDRWVTESGNREDGSPYMGEDAVREVIVERMGAAVSSNQAIRAESIFYNILAAPGYPEMIDEMVALNVDRQLTAFVVGDTPMKLDDSATSLQNWATNANGAASNGQDGLVTADTYVGVYYPSGFSTNVDGEEVVVPSSHIALRTLGFNDNVAYPWFAPAGYQRGTVTNAVNVGYVDSEGEFVPVELNRGQRDVLYTNKINPIAFRPNQGLVVFGQKTRHPLDSAQDRINVVRLVNYLRYQLPQLAEPFLFEPNDDITRRNVTTVFTRFMSELVTLRALFDFLVVCDNSNNTPARIDRNELWVDVLIQPVKAIEFIYVPVRIRNTGSDLTLAQSSESPPPNG